MGWLVNAYFAAARKRDGSKFSPARFAHIRDFNVFRFEVFQGRREVIAHQVKLVPIVVLGIMERGFEGRHGENQPALAGINRGKLEDVAKKARSASGSLL